MKHKPSYALAALLASTSLASADITNTVGLSVITPTFTTVSSDTLVNNPQPGNPHQVIFAEQQGVTLLADLPTDTGVIPAGTNVNSYFVILDRDSPTVLALTSATFSNPVLGLIYKQDAGYNPSPYFSTSNPVLGLTGITYNTNCFQCAFETQGNSPYLPDASGFLGNTVFNFNHYSGPGDFERIVTASAVPGPLAGAGLPGLAVFGMLLGWFRRKRTMVA